MTLTLFFSDDKKATQGILWLVREIGKEIEKSGKGWGIRK